jgi:hypothetical protein
VRGEVTRASSKDVWSEYLDKYHYSILDNFLIEPKLFSSSIRHWFEVLKDYLLSVDTNKQVLYLRLPCLVVVRSSKVMILAVLIEVSSSVTRKVDLRSAEEEADRDIVHSLV